LKKESARLDRISDLQGVLKNFTITIILVMTDFIVNLLGDSTSSWVFVEQFDALNLSVVSMVEPTHFQFGASPSLLDLFLTNNPPEVSFFTQIDPRAQPAGRIMICYMVL
jgi:hypothetical protein